MARLSKDVLTPNDAPRRAMRKMPRVEAGTEEAKQIAEAPGVAWEIEEIQIDGKSQRVLAGPSNDTVTATEMIWTLLEKEAYHVIAVTQSRDMAIPAVRRNFPRINEWASDYEIQELLDAQEEDEDANLKKFGIQKWIGNVIHNRVGILSSSTLQRYRRRKNQRQKK